MMQRKKRKLSLALFIVLMLLFSMPLAVMANDPSQSEQPPEGPNYNLDDISTSITIGRCNGTCEHVITATKEWNRSIRVTEGTHTIIFDSNVTIASKDDSTAGYIADAPAFEVASGATVTLILNANKTVTLNSKESTGAGLSVQSGANLYIQGEGKLITQGAKGGAGIGGAANTAGNITIKSGTIEAKGGEGAAGIGSGKLGGHQAITIEGGTITATGGNGYEESEGGTKHSNVGGPGIGFPQSVGESSTSTKGTVTISGGTITATGGTKSSNPQSEKVNGIQCQFLQSGNGSANITTTPSSLDGINEISSKFNGVVWQEDGSRGNIWGKAELTSFPAASGGVSLWLEKDSSLIIPDFIPGSNGPTFIHGDDSNIIVNPNNLAVPPTIIGDIQPRASFSSNEVDYTDSFVYTGEDLTEKAIVERTRQNGTNYLIDKTNWYRYIQFNNNTATRDTQICDAGKYQVFYKHKSANDPNPIPESLKDFDPNIFDDSFEIGPINVEQADLRECIFEPIEDQSYTGDPIRPDISITYKGGESMIALVPDKDYVIDEDGWQNNIGVGTASMKILGKGNFKISRDEDGNNEIIQNFEIIHANLAEATVEQPKSEVYNGKEHKEPALTVKMGNKMLTAGKDYIATPSTDNFIDAGTIVYTITANDADEDCPYTGTAPEMKFTIEPKVIRVNPNSSVEAKSRSYNGKSTIDFEEPGAELVGLESRDKGEVQLMTGIIDETGSPNVGEYKKIKFDKTTTLSGEKAGNYKLAEGQTLTLKTPVEITKLTPKYPIEPNGSYKLSEAYENKFVYTISIDKESGVSYEFSMDGGTPVNGIDDPDNPGKVVVEIPFDNIRPEEPHTFTVYSKGDVNVEAIEVGSITESFEKLPRDPEDVPPDPVPEIIPNADRKSFDITIPKMLDENGKEIPAEYRFDGPDGEEGEWGTSNVKTNCAPLSEYTCYIRYLPTEVYGPSEPGKATVKTEAAPASTDGPAYSYTFTPINPDNPDDSILSPGIMENVGGTDAVTAELNAALAVMDGYNWDNIKYYDLTIMVKYYDEAGVQQERPATAADFDAKGGVLPVTIKSNNLPSGTNVKKNDFAIAHMFSEDYGGHTAGEIETWENEQSQPLQKTTSGLKFDISGTSPIAIAWKDATNPDEPVDPGTTDPGTTDPGTTDPGTTDPGTTDPGTTDPGTTTPNQNQTEPLSDAGNQTQSGNNNQTGNTNGNNTGTGTGSQGQDSQSIADALKSAVSSLAPKTGDTSKLIMWAVIAAAACIAVIVAIRSKIKSGKKGKATAQKVNAAAPKSGTSAKKTSTSAATTKKTTTTTKKSTGTTASKKTSTTAKKSTQGTAKKTTTKK